MMLPTMPIRLPLIRFDYCCAAATRHYFPPCLVGTPLCSDDADAGFLMSFSPLRFSLMLLTTPLFFADAAAAADAAALLMPRCR